MLDSKTLLNVTGQAPNYNLSTHDLPAMAMPLRRFFFAGEDFRSHSAALCSQGDMYAVPSPCLVFSGHVLLRYDAEEFWWDAAQSGDGEILQKSQKDSKAGTIGSRDGGVLASNVMHLAAFQHLKELWMQKRHSGVPWSDLLVARALRCLFFS